jgi:hypothetical protein
VDSSLLGRHRSQPLRRRPLVGIVCDVSGDEAVEDHTGSSNRITAVKIQVSMVRSAPRHIQNWMPLKGLRRGEISRGRPGLAEAARSLSVYVGG